MRKSPLLAIVLPLLLLLLLLSATPVPALEKTAVRGVEGKGEWTAGVASCSIGYYNICTGYVWVWSDWADGSMLGTVYEGCCNGSGGAISSSFFYYRTGVQGGWGFTGMASIQAVDANDCPTGVIGPESQPILPATGWNYLLWTGTPVPPRFAQVHTIADFQGFGSPVTIATDGAGGACGVCFPTTRTTSSYTWGTTASPLCPGFAMNDGTCNVEFLSNATLLCDGPDAVENRGWGEIKSLYR